MTVLGLLLMVPASIVCLVGSIMMIVAAFRTSVGWGLLVLFVPLGALVFLILHWQAAKRSFFINLAGTGMMVLAVIVLFAGSASSARVAIAEAGAPPAGLGDGSPTTADGASTDEPGRASTAEPGGASAALAGEATAPAGTPGYATADGAASSAHGTAMPPGPGLAPASSPSEPAGASLPPTPGWAAPEPVSLSASDPGGIHMKGLARYVGQELVFVLKGGEPIRGKLLATDSESVRIERSLPSGSAQFLLLRSELQEVRLVG